MTTLKELYEYVDAKTLDYKIIVGGADITTRVTSFDYTFEIGTTPTATLTMPRVLLTPAVSEESAVEIWIGFRRGMTNLRALVFGGAIVNSLSFHGTDAVVECLMDGARRINFPYYKEILYNFDNVSAQDSVTALLTLAGVFNFKVDLDVWDIGTIVPQKIQFSNYAEAINKVAEVDGSPWYCMPTGQIRVEARDPLPYDTPARVYYAANLIAINESQPASVTDPNLRPRILELSKEFDRAGVSNFIQVDGAMVVTVGPLGEQNSEQVSEEVDGDTGTFVNGAPWIPTPPHFQAFTYSNELIDTNAKANSVATRYFNLKNRLIQNLTATVPLDPLLFLAMTAQITDPFTNTDDLYFLKAYHCSVDGTNAVSELTLLGGPFSGTQGQASPFAEFIWKYKVFYDQPGTNPFNSANLFLGWGCGLAAKLCQDLPANVGDPTQGGDIPTAKSGMVMITYDGSPSQDFDGQIVLYAWSDTQGHVKTSASPRFTVMYDPDVDSSIEMTLTVTDNDAKTDAITKTVYIKFDAPVGPLPDDPTLDDSLFGGGAASGDCTDGGSPHGGNGPGGKNGMALVYFVAAGCKAMATANNVDWNELDNVDLGVGEFISVAVSSVYANSIVYAVFGTDQGEVVLTIDGCQTGNVVLRIAGQPLIECILYDTKDYQRVWLGTNDGRIYTSLDGGQTWDLYHDFQDKKSINKLITSESNLWVFGGDTNTLSSLIRVDLGKQKAWSSVTFSRAMQAAIQTAGAGFSIVAAGINNESLLVGFNGGVSPVAWTATDPLNNPETWVASDGITGSGVLAVAPGEDGKFLVSTDDGIFRTLDSENFDLGDTSPVNDLAWEGLDGVYVGVKGTSVTKTIDDGNTNGDLRPNPDLSSPSWPACAVGKKVATGSIPRDTDNGNWPANSVANLSFSGGFPLFSIAPTIIPDTIYVFRYSDDPILIPPIFVNMSATLLGQFHSVDPSIGLDATTQIWMCYATGPGASAPNGLQAYIAISGVDVGSASGQVSYAEGASIEVDGFGTAVSGEGVIACCMLIVSHNPIAPPNFISDMDHVLATQTNLGDVISRIDYSFAPGSVRTLKEQLQSTVYGACVAFSVKAAQL